MLDVKFLAAGSNAEEAMSFICKLSFNLINESKGKQKIDIRCQNIDEAIKSTIENNAKVKLALEKLEESKELVIYSSRENLPSITGTITGTYESADTDTATTSTTPETFTDSYKLVISKNIYDAGVNKLEIERSKILYNNELINELSHASTGGGACLELLSGRKLPAIEILDK